MSRKCRIRLHVEKKSCLRGCCCTRSHRGRCTQDRGGGYISRSLRSGRSRWRSRFCGRICWFLVLPRSPAPSFCFRDSWLWCNDARQVRGRHQTTRVRLTNCLLSIPKKHLDSLQCIQEYLFRDRDPVVPSC